MAPNSLHYSKDLVSPPFSKSSLKDTISTSPLSPHQLKNNIPLSPCNVPLSQDATVEVAKEIVKAVRRYGERTGSGSCELARTRRNVRNIGYNRNFRCKSEVIGSRVSVSSFENWSF